MEPPRRYRKIALLGVGSTVKNRCAFGGDRKFVCANATASKEQHKLQTDQHRIRFILADVD